MARDELWASETNCNENLCKAAFLWVLDVGGAADFLLARFLMTVCNGCASEVGSKVYQLPLQSAAAAATTQKSPNIHHTQTPFCCVLGCYPVLVEF